MGNCCVSKEIEIHHIERKIDLVEKKREFYSFFEKLPELKRNIRPKSEKQISSIDMIHVKNETNIEFDKDKNNEHEITKAEVCEIDPLTIDLGQNIQTVVECFNEIINEGNEKGANGTDDQDILTNESKGDTNIANSKPKKAKKKITTIDPNQQLLLSMINVYSSFENLKAHLEEKNSLREEEIITLFLDICKKIKAEENYINELNDFIRLINMDILKMQDPIEIHNFLLKLFNDNESIDFENVPSFYYDGTNIISVKFIETARIEFQNFFKKFIPKTFCLGKVIPFRQKCSKPLCPKREYCSIQCDGEITPTFLLREALQGIDEYTDEEISKERWSVIDEVNQRYQEKKFTATCQYCKTKTKDYRVEEQTIFINLPKYLFIKLKFENEFDKYIDGASINVNEVKSIFLGNNEYEILGAIVEVENKFNVLTRNQGKWKENEMNQNFVIENAHMVYYERKDFF